MVRCVRSSSSRVVALFESEKIFTCGIGTRTTNMPPVRRAGFVTRPAPGVPKCRSRSLLPLVLLVHTTTALWFRIHTRAERSTSPRVCPMFALRRAAARAVAARGSFNPQRVALRAFAAQCPHDPSKPYHKSPLPLDAAGGLLEYSVVYTDRAMNHMSKPFCKVRLAMRASSPGAPRPREAPGTAHSRPASRHRPKHAHEKYRTMRTGCVFAPGDLAGGTPRHAADASRRPSALARRMVPRAKAPRRAAASSAPLVPPARARVPDGSSPSANTDATEHVLSPLRAFRPRNRPRRDASRGV